MTRPIPYPLRAEWAITAAGRDQVIGVWETAHAMGRTDRLLAAVEEREGKSLDNQHEFTVERGVALIPVEGPLFRKAELFSDLSGATSYEWITRQLTAVRAMQAAGEVQAAVLIFNSPGGEAAGTSACADAIRVLADEMPVWGYVETQASSAAWWLASQCSFLVAHRSAFVGSIGVRRMIPDGAEAEKKAGVVNHEIISDGSPGKRGTPVDEAVLARAQRSVDDLMAEFVSDVAKGRGVSRETVLADYGQGDELIASRALAAGMIDEIGDLESIIARLGTESAVASTPFAASGGATTRGATSMARPSAYPTPPRASAEDKPEKKDPDHDGDEHKARAEEDKPEMVKCKECGGSGKNADGAECKHCDGEGEIEKTAKAEVEHEEPDGDEGRKALAALSGLRASASLSAHVASVEARMVPRSALSALEKRVASVEAERQQERELAETARVNELADEAAARGYFAGLDATKAKDKRARFVAIARREPDAAEAILEALPAARVTGRVTSQGNPLDGKHSARPRIDPFAATETGHRVNHGDVDVIEVGTPDLMTRAQAHAAAHKCGIEEAMIAVAKADPSLMR